MNTGAICKSCCLITLLCIILFVVFPFMAFDLIWLDISLLIAAIESVSGVDYYDYGKGELVAGVLLLFIPILVILFIGTTCRTMAKAVSERTTLWPFVVANLAIFLMIYVGFIFQYHAAPYLEVYAQLDYHGPMTVIACGTLYYSKYDCRSVLMASCDFHEAVMEIKWQIPQQDKTCTSMAWLRKCAEDVCSWYDDVGDLPRCPLGEKHHDLNTTAQQNVMQCLENEYPLFDCTTEYADATFYGNTQTCDVWPESSVHKDFYHKCDLAGKVLMTGGGFIVVALIARRIALRLGNPHEHQALEAVEMTETGEEPEAAGMTATEKEDEAQDDDALFQEIIMKTLDEIHDGKASEHNVQHLVKVFGGTMA